MKKLLINLEEKHPKLYEIFKFLLVGGLATVIDMLTMALVLYFSNPAHYNNNFINTLLGQSNPNSLITVVATGTGFLFGLLFNYAFSISFVFNKTNTSFAKTKKGFLSFSSLSLIGFIIHISGMALGHKIFEINEWIIKIFLTIVVLSFNYISRKKIIFNKQKEENI